MIYPSLEKAQELCESGSFKIVPVSLSLYADIGTPIEILRRLKASSRHCFMLESIEDARRWGRYTFLGLHPRLELSCTDGLVTLRDGEERQIQTKQPADVIRQILAENKSPRLPGLPPFTGGLVGYFAYDTIKYVEPTLQLKAEDDAHFKDLDLMLFDQIICFDHFRQKMILIVHASTDNLAVSYPKAIAKLKQLAGLVRRGQPADIQPLRLLSRFQPLLDKEAFCNKVDKARQHIREGDIFQVVLSNRLAARMSGSLFDVYRVLRTTNPSPYMFYFSSDDIEIAGASPETLVKLEDRRLYTYPLAGTRPRGRDEAEDLAMEQELRSDEKELAEHNMLVDLGRNDIGRIAEIGSVRVEKYLGVERFSHVMHLGSTVSGLLRPGLDALDAVSAILPAGTLSGAPKIRACSIIDALENNKRGLYGGAIGYLDFSGNLDTCIAIRMAYKKNDMVYIRTGAGIVADSVPEKEHQECLNKARAVIQAIEMAEGGIDT